MAAFTFTYKTAPSGPITATLYHQGSLDKSPKPLVIYWHGGGLTVGTSESYFPHWLCNRVLKEGFLFLSANYTLIPPGTIHDVLQDIRDLFTFISTGYSCLPNVPLINNNAIAVSGTSAGGLCAYLAAIHAEPKPKALLSLYGLGGDFFTSHHLTPKTEPFFRGRDLLDPAFFSQYLYPNSIELPPTSESPLEYAASDAPIPGYPTNPRMVLGRLYLQLGIGMDYYTGSHGISAELRQRIAQGITRDDTPKEHLPILPQLNVSSRWPPSYFLHGSLDSAVPVGESRNLHSLLVQAGVHSTLHVVEGKEHSFDYVPDAEKEFGKEVFDAAVNFLEQRLKEQE